MVKRLTLIPALVAALVAPSSAQVPTQSIILAAHYDLDASAYTYCRTVGISGRADDRPIPGRVLLAAAASTTVTGTNAFANVAVGDVLIINDGGTTYERVVEARASANSITISGAAVTLTAPNSPTANCNAVRRMEVAHSL